MALFVPPIGVLRDGSDIALVVGLTMVLVVIIGSQAGMSLPFLLSCLRLDPATASAPWAHCFKAGETGRAQAD